MNLNMSSTIYENRPFDSESTLNLFLLREYCLLTPLSSLHTYKFSVCWMSFIFHDSILSCSHMHSVSYFLKLIQVSLLLGLCVCVCSRRGTTHNLWPSLLLFSLLRRAAAFFISFLIIASKWKYNLLLCLDLVSCNFNFAQFTSLNDFCEFLHFE